MAEKGQCESCGHLYSMDYLYHREGGWVRARSEGGTHALRLRKADHSMLLCRLEEFICKDETRRDVPDYATETFKLAEVPK